MVNCLLCSFNYWYCHTWFSRKTIFSVLKNSKNLKLAQASFAFLLIVLSKLSSLISFRMSGPMKMPSFNFAWDKPENLAMRSFFWPSFDKLFHETKLYVKLRKYNFFRINKAFSFNVFDSRLDCISAWPYFPHVMLISSTTVPFTQKTWEFWVTFLLIK